MYVVATAGHVNHGKSTLVRALTGMEPDRLESERRRGLTIDLGFAWTTLPSGRAVAFVDVPGHQRFLGNMLAGIGPAPVVCFLVAADAGWQAQSDDHRDAVAALDIRHGLIVISRADRAPDRADGVLAQARAELAATGLRHAPAIAVSATTGDGMDDLRIALDDVLSRVPPPTATGRLRLWVDRSFTITGTGTVVTGTLTAGTLTPNDRLQMVGHGGQRPVAVRGLQSRGQPLTEAAPVDRVALNLRGIHYLDVHRGDALVTPDAWPTTHTLDVRRVTGTGLTEAPEEVIVHVGTAAVPARQRPFDDDHARLRLDRQLPLVVGDRLILRNPGAPGIIGGAQVLDADPPTLRRRGDGTRRGRTLAGMTARGDLEAEVARRGSVRQHQLDLLGLAPAGAPIPPRVRVVGDWWVHQPTYQSWQLRLQAAVANLTERDPLSPGLSRGAARDLLGLPDEALLSAVAADAGLEQVGGLLWLQGSRAELGPAEVAVSAVEERLRADPFGAPGAGDLATLGLGTRELAAAERAGRILRLRDEVVLLPSAPALAVKELAGLPQPFTTSQARQALHTTRRVVIPLLEHLDARGWTRRLDPGHREVVDQSAAG